MKQTFFYLFISFSGLALSSCIFSSEDGSESLIIGRSAIDLEEQKRREKARSEKVNRGKCKDHRECENMCEDVYNEDGNREDEGKVEKCLDLSYQTAISFANILEVIEEPYYDHLTNIKAKNFEAFLDVSVAPWVEKTKRLNNSEAEALLRWIARESKVASSIVSAYENLEDYDLYEGMQALFQEIAPDLGSSYTNTTAQGRAVRRCAEFCSSVSNKILAQSRSFWDIISRSSNTSGRAVACDILRLKCRHDGSSVIRDVNVSHCPSSVRAPLASSGCNL